MSLAETTLPQADGLLLDEQLCFAAYSLAQAFGRVYRPGLERLGLTYPQYLVMLVLWEEDNQSVGQIGGKLHLDSGTLTPLLKRLEAAGCVTRQRDTADERLVRVRLTPAGKALKAGAAEVRKGVACATGLGTGDIGALKDDLIRLRDTLNSTLGSPP